MSAGNRDGWVFLPEEPTEEMWSGLARQIVMWMRMSDRTGKGLHEHLERSGIPIPDWLEVEIPNIDHVPAKGSVAVAIYRAMLDARTDPWISVEDRLPGEQGCDSEDVLVFINGHCTILDRECRQGGAWGDSTGFYDAEKQCFRVHGRLEPQVTHWMPKPKPPVRESKEGAS